ncbi:MAG: carotenoid 1,2-hydratase, partial [Pseudomonadota bacterium]|nr:carotenoid 1,2-hydratase [Pseudomonadota bacterium]
MFSPYYARARRRAAEGAADPQNHCAVNVVLYGPKPAWTMTERGRHALQREAERLRIGASEWAWHGEQLQIEIDEVSVPWPRAVRGHVQVQVPKRLEHAVELAPGHHWCPIAPRARVEVDLGGARWRGWGYLDSNRGDLPLERSFRRWDWSRAHRAGGDAAVIYDVEAIGCAPRSIGLGFGVDG